MLQSRGHCRKESRHCSCESVNGRDISSFHMTRETIVRKKPSETQMRDRKQEAVARCAEWEGKLDKYSTRETQRDTAWKRDKDNEKEGRKEGRQGRKERRKGSPPTSFFCYPWRRFRPTRALRPPNIPSRRRGRPVLRRRRALRSCLSSGDDGFSLRGTAALPCCCGSSPFPWSCLQTQEHAERHRGPVSRRHEWWTCGQRTISDSYSPPLPRPDMFHWLRTAFDFSYVGERDTRGDLSYADTTAMSAESRMKPRPAQPRCSRACTSDILAATASGWHLFARERSTVVSPRHVTKSS